MNCLKAITNIFISLIIGSLSNPSVAAEITILQNKVLGVSPAMSISGELVKGDFSKFSAIAKDLILDPAYQGLEIYLNSPGGNASEAMKIGKLARHLLAKTSVRGIIYYDPQSPNGIEHAQWLANNPDKISNVSTERKFVPLGKKIPDDMITKCYSACVLIFIAGVEKYANNNGYFRNPTYDIPVIGLHRPFYEKAFYSNLSIEKASAAYGNLIQEISDYLANMKAPQNIIEEMLKTSSNNINLVDSKAFKASFPEVEPFLEEWLLAKCGESISGEGVVEVRDLELLDEINSVRVDEAQKYGTNEMDKFLYTMFNYWPEGTTESEKRRFKKATTLIKGHNQRVFSCKKSVVYGHQREWALES